MGGRVSLSSHNPAVQPQGGPGRVRDPSGWEGSGSEEGGGCLLASPRYPPRLQVARGVSPALPHGRVGPTSPPRSLALPLLRILLAVLGVPLPEGVRWGCYWGAGAGLAFRWEGGTHFLLTFALPLAGAGMGSARGP